MGWHRVHVILHLSFFIWTSNATLLARRPFPRFPVCFLVISWVCILPNANAWYFTTISIPHVNIKCFPTPSNRYSSNKTSMQSHKCVRVCGMRSIAFFHYNFSNRAFRQLFVQHLICRFDKWYENGIGSQTTVVCLLDFHFFGNPYILKRSHWRTPSMQIAESFHEITFECSVLRICAFLFSWELTFQTLHYIVAHTNIVLHIDHSIRFAQCDRCFHVKWKFFHKHQRMSYFRFA